MNNGNLRKKLLIAAIAATVAVCTTVSGCSVFNDQSSDSSAKTSEEASVSEVSSSLGGNIAAKSKSYQISLPVMQYLARYNYQRYLSQYGQYMQYYGFDSTVDLHSQYYNEESGVTWYDYFLDMTKQYMEQTLIMAEAAKADGIELDEKDLASIKETMDSMSSSAKESGTTVSQLIVDSYGEGVTEEDIEECLKLTQLAQKYYNKVHDGYKYTEEDYEKYYNEHKESYTFADFMTYSFNYNVSTSSDTSETSVDEESKKEAKKFADELVKCKTQDEFKDYLRDYLKAHPDRVTIQESSESSGETAESSEDALNKAIESAVDAAYTKKYGYEVTSDAGKWIFDSSRKQNDTYIVNGSDNYTVLLMMKPAYRDESINKNVRHILVTSSTYETDEKAKKKADEILEEYNSGEKTAEAFGKLAQKYTEDPGSKNTGGLYENVSEGQMVTEFNDWIFDESRKPGDTGIVKTSYGYHVMYFVGDSLPAWQTAIDTALRTEAFNDHYNKLKEKYTVEFDDEFLKTIEIYTPESSATESAAESAEKSK